MRRKRALCLPVAVSKLPVAVSKLPAASTALESRLWPEQLAGT